MGRVQDFFNVSVEDQANALQALLDQYKEGGDGWALYTDLTPAQVKELAAAVDALGEPLSHLTATVVL